MKKYKVQAFISVTFETTGDSPEDVRDKTTNRLLSLDLLKDNGFIQNIKVKDIINEKTF